MSGEIVLRVNGKPHTVQAAPDTPLLDVLRNEPGLTSPPSGCGDEKCGACMVLVGARATPSCKLPISEVGQARITTLEGLIEVGELHPVQRAFLEEQAAQCGYCLNGMIIPTAALLANAIFDVTGARLRQIPFPPARVKVLWVESQNN